MGAHRRWLHDRSPRVADETFQRRIDVAPRASEPVYQRLRMPSLTLGRRRANIQMEPLSWRKCALRFTIVLAMSLFGCRETPISEVVRGSRELPQTGGRVTAREALALVYPAVLETSKKPVLLLITSGTDINAEGRSGTWEFVFHFPAPVAQGVYSLEPRDPEVSDSDLRLRWRLSPRPDVKGNDAALPLDFTDSPEAVRDLNRAGVDWVAGDTDMTLATKRLPSGEVVWVTESYGKEFATPFVVSIR